MKLSTKKYKTRLVCPLCYSLSFKKSYKEYKCDNCKKTFGCPETVMLLHKDNRCIDNNVESRKDRINKITGKIYYD